MTDIFIKKISKEDIQNLPLLAFEGKIHMADDENTLKDVLSLLADHMILGFDTEKKPTFIKGDHNSTALVQLSTTEDAFLFRLNQIGYSKALFDVFSNPKITKIGISLSDDVKELQKIKRFRSANFVDLNTIAKKMGIIHNGVRKLAAIFLNGRISKNQQTSNWENETLTSAQRRYAATDAWVCIKIYDEMLKRGIIG